MKVVPAPSKREAMNTSCFCLEEKNPLRAVCLRVIQNVLFERVIIAVIVLNSVVLALADYQSVDSRGDLVMRGSWRNAMLLQSEIVFTAVFSVECALKVTALGFYGHNRSYLSDRWNWIDFAVVISGIAALIPGVPNLSVLRTLRVMRPIKVLSTNKDLQAIIHTISASIPELAGVSLLLLCVFLLFGIVGLQTMSGPLLHSRCRLTPYPVRTAWTPAVAYANVSAYRCRDVDNVNQRLGSPFDRASSPWRDPADDCFWPLDESDIRLCGFNRMGLHDCHHDTTHLSDEDWRWCGANYDGFGNPRFSDNRLVRSATFIEDLNFGYSNFDNIGYAVLTAFQCVTMEGWTAVMYMVQDAMSPQAAAVFFVLLEVFGAFCLVNILLAVLSNNFSNAMASGKMRLSSIRLSVRQKQKLLGQLIPKKRRDTYRHRLSIYLKSDSFTNVITALITLNALVLAMDHYPSSRAFDFSLETTNLMFTLLFCIEMLLKLIGFGVKAYVQSSLNIFDAVVVLISVVELIVTPPVLFGGDPMSGGGAVTALRCFRIFRVFKVFTRWTKMKMLLKRILNIVLQTLNLLILLFLFLFINTLLGMQFFANVFRFGADGYVITDIGSEEWLNAAERPRSNFDDFSHSFATVFQILTTENWNNVMYDCWRSRGPGAIIFVILNIIIGNYFLINLFLAIILNQFSAEKEESLKNKVEAPNFSFSDSMKSLGSNHSAGVGSFTSGGGVSLGSGDDCLSIRSSNSVLPMNSSPGQSQSHERFVSSELNPNTEGVASRTADSLQCSTAAAPDKAGKEESGREVELASAVLPSKIVEQAASADSADESASKLEHFDEAESDSSSVSDEEPKVVIAPLTCDDVLELLSSQMLSCCCFSGAKEAVEPTTVIPTPAPLESQQSILSLSVPLERICEVPNSMCMSPQNSIRICAAKIVKWKHFDNVVIFAILISCVSLAMDNPLLNPHDSLPKILAVIDLVILYIFIIEMFVKIAVFGFAGSPTSYMRQGWNQLDVMVIATSLLDLILTDSGLDSLRALRALRALKPLRALRAVRAVRAVRALRPLRLVNRSAGLKVVINTLFASIPDVTNVFILCFIFYFIFAIIGVNYFKGGLRACQGSQFDDVISSESMYLDLLSHPQSWSSLADGEKDLFGYESPLYADPAKDCARGAENSWPLVDQPCCPDYSATSSDVTSKDICLCWNAIWAKQYRYGFDNVLEGLFTLFQMSTTEGWVDAMYAIVDFRDIDMQPERDHTIGWVYFCILFMIVGSFFALNIFVGVVVNNFSLMKKRDMQESSRGQSAFMTPRQQAWVETHSLLARISPLVIVQRPAENYWRGLAFDLCEAKLFNYFISLCIVLNTISMGIHYFGESDLYGFVLESMNLAFCCVFTVEVGIKLFAYGSEFTNELSNIFDLLVVIAIDIGFAVYFVGGSRFGTTISVLQALRLAKLMKFVSSTGSVGTILETVTQTLPSMGNISLLMGLLFFIYTVMGINIFAKVQYGDHYNVHANFRDFGSGILLLFRAATGESWNYVMGDLARSGANNCVKDPEYDDEYCGFSNNIGCIELNGCGSVLAYPYFISFTVIMSLVFINLFIGIILEGFESANDLNCAVTSTDIKAFTKHWSRYDPMGSFFITSVQLEHFLYTLPVSLKRNKKEFSNIRDIRKFIANTSMKVFGDGNVHFRDVLVVISKNVLLQITEEEISGTITEEDSLELYREHMSSAETMSNTARTARFLFSSLGKRGGGGSGEGPKFAMHSSRNIQEDYAARLLLKCLRRAVYNRKRELLRTPSPRVCDSAGVLSSGERNDDRDADHDIEVMIPQDDDDLSDTSIVVVEPDEVDPLEPVEELDPLEPVEEVEPLEPVEGESFIEPIRKNVVSLPPILTPLRVIGKRTPAKVEGFLECCDSTSSRSVDDIAAMSALPAEPVPHLSTPLHQELGTSMVYQPVETSDSENSQDTIPNLSPVPAGTSPSTASPEPESSPTEGPTSGTSTEKPSVAIKSSFSDIGSVDTANAEISDNKRPTSNGVDIIDPAQDVCTAQEVCVDSEPGENNCDSSVAVADQDVDLPNSDGKSPTPPIELPDMHHVQQPAGKENAPEFSEIEVKIHDMSKLHAASGDRAETVAISPLRREDMSLSDSVNSTRTISPDMWPGGDDSFRQASPCGDACGTVEELLVILAAQKIDSEIKGIAAFPEFDELSSDSSGGSDSHRELTGNIDSSGVNVSTHFKAVRTAGEDDDLYDF